MSEGLDEIYVSFNIFLSYHSYVRIFRRDLDIQRRISNISILWCSKSILM